MVVMGCPVDGGWFWLIRVQIDGREVVVAPGIYFQTKHVDHFYTALAQTTVIMALDFIVELSVYRMANRFIAG